MKRNFKYLMKYELLNNLYNGYSFFFGCLFPILLSNVIAISIRKQAPADMQSEALTSLFIGMSMIIPLATLFLGYAATYANELEKDVPTRLSLHGISQKRLFLGKLAANYVFLTFCVVLYLVGTLLTLNIAKPTLAGAVAWILILYLLSAFFLIMAHGIANWIRKFGITYGIVMGIYFILMILSGMMGISNKDLPKFLQSIAKLIPLSHMQNNFVDFWMGKSYNFGPLIQSLIFFGAISLLILLISFKVRGRKGDL